MRRKDTMSIEKTMLRANRLVAVLPQYVRPDMERIVELVNEQQKQIDAQEEQIKANANTILEQREQLKLVRDRNTELSNALVSIGYMTPSAECTSRQRVAAATTTLNEMSREMVI